MEDIEDEIIWLKQHVKQILNILAFHKLDKIPPKYCKAFPKQDEYPYFECPEFKDHPDKVGITGHGGFELKNDIKIPNDQEELDKAKQRMLALAPRAIKNEKAAEEVRKRNTESKKDKKG